MHSAARNTRILSVMLMLITTVQNGCQSTGPQLNGSGSGDMAKSVVEIEGATDGLMGYINFDGQNRAYFFGQKTSEGEVTDFQAMAVVTRDGRMFQYSFDSEGRMVQLIDEARTVDFTYSADGSMFTLSGDGTTEEYPIPDGFADVLDAIDRGTELFESGDPGAAAATRPFPFRTFIKAVALPATALGGLVSAAAATTVSPVLLGLAGVAALGASIKGAIDIAQEATNRPLTPTEQYIREVADIPVLVNDTVTFGTNLNTLAQHVTRAPNAPSVKEALDALKDARDGAKELLPIVDKGLTVALELATADDSTSNEQTNEQTLEGCWDVNLVEDGGSQDHEIWQIENRQLARIWGENNSGLLLETARFTQANAQEYHVRDTRQSISFQSGGSLFSMTFSYVVWSTFNGQTFNSLERTSEVTEATIDGTRFSGRFRMFGRLANIDLKKGFQGYQDYDVSGEVLGTAVACPNISDDDVFSQEEYVQALNELSGS